MLNNKKNAILYQMHKCDFAQLIFFLKIHAEYKNTRALLQASRMNVLQWPPCSQD